MRSIYNEPGLPAGSRISSTDLAAAFVALRQRASAFFTIIGSPAHFRGIHHSTRNSPKQHSEFFIQAIVPVFICVHHEQLLVSAGQAGCAICLRLARSFFKSQNVCSGSFPLGWRFRSGLDGLQLFGHVPPSSSRVLSFCRASESEPESVISVGPFGAATWQAGTFESAGSRESNRLSAVE